MKIEDLDTTKCIFCEQPFQHKTKERKIKGSEAKEFKLVVGHPKCEQLNNKIIRVHKQLQKQQVKLSETRMNLVGLKYEEFLNKHKVDTDDTTENDCVVAILKSKDIL